MISARELAAYVVVASFLALFLSCGMSEGPVQAWLALKDETRVSDSLGGMEKIGRMPDVSLYEPLRTLKPEEFPLGDANRRVIMVGDVHGKIDPLNKLLEIVNYAPESDIFIHTGDIIAKGPHRDSMAVLSFMAGNNITGVRGNHDQKVIEWKGWIDWISSFTEGREWLKRVERDWDDRQKCHKKVDLDDFLDNEKKVTPSRDKMWWRLIPKDWVLLGDHYRIAREMSRAEYEYLLRLPLRLYVPSAHAYIVHAGLLPSDPRYPYFDAKRQPLARIPRMKGRIRRHDNSEGGQAERNIGRLRNLQEIGILTEVPQNKDPWVSLNMRSVKNTEVSRKSDGKDWFNIWANEMKHCAGYYGELGHGGEPDAKKHAKKHDLPCYPASVVYGHMASAGLNIRRWSLGLDSGCVYGRRLSALLIGSPKVVVERDDAGDYHGVEPEDDNDDNTTDTSGKKKRPRNGDVVPFGDQYEAQVISVKCSD